MRVLGIETSCDETGIAIYDDEKGLLANQLYSQVKLHADYGGVVPELASRKHIEAICGVCDECLDVAAQRLGMERLTWADLDGVGVTYAPGLVGALVVGVAFAKGAAWAADKPLVGVNHLEGHMYANKIGAPDFAPPAVVSLVSGGNTMLVHMRGWGDYRVLGATIDDAVGEAFDKVAKALGLGYPGGPVVSAQGAKGNPKAIEFPRAMMHSGDMRFSLSGLKTAVVTYINNERAAGRELLAECIELCGCPVGESRLTKGYALPARHVIHTVGPVWLGGASDEVETLRRAVTSALDIARDMKFETVAFCCISRGIHRFPVDLAAKTTLEAMLAHDFAGRVTVCAYTDEDLEAYKALLPQ